MIVSSDIEQTAPPPLAPPRRPRSWIVPAVAGLLLAVTVIGASTVKIPYYAIAPGESRPVEPRISVTGTETFPPLGQVDFVTVSVPRLTALGAAVGWLDPHSDVYTEEQILGDRTPQENRQENLRLMGYSKDFATYVALTTLGFPVKVTGGGVAVDEVVPEAPAAKVLQPQDLITAIDGTEVHLATDIRPLLEGKQASDVVDLTVVRKGETLSLSTALFQADDRVILGIIPNPNPPDTINFEFPIDVSITSGQIGGPSAGLAYTLELLDVLTPGELTGGNQVAATGTMELDGRVGEIGGLRQKTVAVSRTAAKVFLVPESEKQEALDGAKGTDLQVIGVRTLQDALAALAQLGGNGLELGTPGAGFQPAG